MVMGGAEFLSLGASTLLTGLLKYAANKQEFTARMEEMRIMEEKERVAAFQKAREADVHWVMRLGRTLMILGAIAGYLFPIIAPALWDVTVTYYYLETSQGFWPWSVTIDEMHSVTVGSGNNPIFITPTNQMMMMSIIGFLFGTSTQQK